MAISIPVRATARFLDMPIRRKLMVITVLTTAVALTVSGIGIILADSYLFKGYLLRDLSALARIIGDNSTAALSFDDQRAAAETLASLRARPHVEAACIYRANGSALASYLRSSTGAGCPASIQPLVSHQIAPDRVETTSDHLSGYHSIVLKGTQIGELVLIYDFGEIDQRIRLYTMVVAAMLLIASLVGFVLSAELRGLIATPISNLAATAATVSETKDYAIRAPKASRDELGILVDSFNEMLSGIQSRDSDLRRALTEREQALRDAQNARDSLATTLGSIGDAVISTDVEGRVVLVNRAAEALLGWPESQIVGKPLGDVFRIFNEYTREIAESPVNKVLKEGKVAGLGNHTVLLARDGSEIPIDDSGAPIRDQSGNIRGTVLVFRDVSSKRRAEETSRLLAAIVQSSDDAIIGQDLDGTITSWNKGAERIFGYTEHEMIGQRSSKLAPTGQDEMPAVLQRIRRGEKVEQYLAVRCTRDGTRLHVSVTVSPLYDALGRIAGASAIARDVTEQVRANETLAALNADLKRSNERLALSNEDLERFAFIASHDFQEPLRMISVYSQLLVKSFPNDLDERAGMFVDNIVSGTQRIRDLLADLLEYTEVGVKPHEPAHAVDLNLVLKKVLASLAGSISETCAAIDSDPLPVVIANEGHFVSLFQNLISNALKYRSDVAPHVTITVRRDGSDIRFEVADNGIGISSEFHDKIFVAFKRLHGKQIPGTGVGLAICQRVVQRYGGRIWVESEVGKGATFVITLPATLFPGEERIFGTLSN